ncbi:MAG TPA: DUF3570 domain-containing protein [Myxococcota bacterium]|nr:DUF3570 domain-containing protein [Myxococcota bacterium]
MRRSRRERRRERGTLRALTSSALALIGAASKASADTAIDHYEAAYSFSNYSEDPLKSSKTIPGGETQRYNIDTQQASLAGPVTDWLDLGLVLTHETMSGASPWFTQRDAAGSPIQIMSGATISDTRNDLKLHGNYYTDEGRLGFGGGYSTENDFTAMDFGVDGERHFNEKNTTLSGGLGASFDTITPTDPQGFPTRPTQKSKQSYSGFLGLSQIINRRSILQASFTYNFGNGYLSDPYKEVYQVGAQTQFGDFRPNQRHQFAFLVRYNRHLEETESTIHLTYQYYVDTWAISSHTAELAWYQNFGDSFQLAPHVRYYSQSKADFYFAYLRQGATPPDNMSSDFRLSAYGALSFGIKAEYTFHTPWWRDIEWRTNASVERYLSSGDLSLASVSVAAPGLVNFTVFSVGISMAF